MLWTFLCVHYLDWTYTILINVVFVLGNNTNTNSIYFILNVACLYRCFSPPIYACTLMVGIYLKSLYLNINYYHTPSTGYMIGLGSYNFIRQCIRSSSNRGLCMVLWSVRERRMAKYRWLQVSRLSVEEQPSTSIHYQEKTTIIQTALIPRKEKDAYHLLDRPGHVVLARLRSGHNRLNVHMHRKLKIVPSPTCPCGEEYQTTEHVLQICNIHQPERIAQWPSATPLHQKWYGGLGDLKKTTNFITAVGLVV